jgi:hypothetical protein
LKLQQIGNFVEDGGNIAVVHAAMIRGAVKWANALSGRS